MLIIELWITKRSAHFRYYARNFLSPTTIAMSGACKETRVDKHDTVTPLNATKATIVPYGNCYIQIQEYAAFKESFLLLPKHEE